MFCSSNNLFNPSTIPKSNTNPFHQIPPSSKPTFQFKIHCKTQNLTSRITTVKNTQKITEAMKLVAAAKVRRAQEAVINSRPFSKALAEMLYNINEFAQLDDIYVPLATVRPVRKVALVVITGDRGLCGGFNNGVIRKTEGRIMELKKLGLECKIISVGKKGNAYFSRRMDSFNVVRFVEGEGFPSVKEAQIIADDVFALFVSEEVDRVEVLYTKFVSLVRFDPVFDTLLPLEKGCVGNEDELFRLSSKEGKLAVLRERVEKRRDGSGPVLEFEQDPAQILDALMPLYLNGQVLRAMQESVASELAARMNAMSNASENAVELRKTLLRAYNRERQDKITGEILEIVAGAEALTPVD